MCVCVYMLIANLLAMQDVFCRVIIRQLVKQTIVNEFDTHWVL